MGNATHMEKKLSKCFLLSYLILNLKKEYSIALQKKSTTLKVGKNAPRRYNDPSLSWMVDICVSVSLQGFIEMEDKETATTFLDYYSQVTPTIRYMYIFSEGDSLLMSVYNLSKL